MNIKSFRRWCEDRGKLWRTHGSFKDFERIAKEYESYRADEQTRTKDPA
jgi:hypothetical protein